MEHYWHIQLEYPPQASLPYDAVIAQLLRAHQLSLTVPFAPRAIDKPHDGQVHVVFQPPGMHHFPPDGIRFLEAEQRFAINANGGDIEVMEVKYGFVPGGSEPTASRVRRRYRLMNGGNPSIFLIHYTRGPAIAVPPQMMNQHVRSYPIPAPTEQPVFIAGERAFQKAYGQPGGQHAIAMQNQAMAQMERARREKSRTEASQRQLKALEAEEGEEEHVNARSLARERFKRNHEYLAEIFSISSIAQLEEPPLREPATAVPELEAKLAKLNQEIQALEETAELRKRHKRNTSTDEEMAQPSNSEPQTMEVSTSA
jgi:hypothetical protein